jgi:hypothetical protein
MIDNLMILREVNFYNEPTTMDITLVGIHLHEHMCRKTVHARQTFDTLLLKAFC